ncbi:axoneme-associated protein mst101(2)-like [Drosophila miranda]|uniref:axoneme-associated protein mst101(2)-like n=1 Tax=Drosophila miranda TaxID=7229 RepID=UPI00143F648C|nr:axoneme-associated protein mst101(2)-like [Drosophila miranda]
MIKNRVDKCIIEKTKAFKECVEGSADKQQQDILRIMMRCLKTGIRKICADSVMSASRRGPAQTEPNAVDIIQTKCRGMGENKKLQAPGGNQAERSRFAKKVDQCVASEWKDLCSSRCNLSEKEQVELDRMQQCVCDQIKENSRKQVLREMCVDGGQQLRKKANSEVLSFKARPKEVAEEVPKEKPSPPPKESLNPEVEKCVQAKLQTVEGFIRSLSDDEDTARENISECARIKLREQCEAEIQQRKLEEIQRKKCLEKRDRKEAEVQQRKLAEKRARKEAEALRRKCQEKRARKEAEAKAKDDKCLQGGPRGGGGAEAVVNQELLKHFREWRHQPRGPLR